MTNPNTAEEILQEKAKVELRILKENGFATGNLERAMQEHTAQTLDSLKEKVKRKKQYDKDGYNSYWNNALDDVIILIEEVSDGQI